MNLMQAPHDQIVSSSRCFAAVSPNGVGAYQRFGGIGSALVLLVVVVLGTSRVKSSVFLSFEGQSNHHPRV
jgi:hypothetical protein